MTLQIEVGDHRSGLHQTLFHFVPGQQGTIMLLCGVQCQQQNTNRNTKCTIHDKDVCTSNYNMVFTSSLLTILAFGEGVVSIALRSAAALYSNKQQ